MASLSDTAATVKFARDLFNMPNVFFPIAVARDVGVVFGSETFADDQCCELGEGGLLGLDDMVPKLPCEQA